MIAVFMTCVGAYWDEPFADRQWAELVLSWSEEELIYQRQLGAVSIVDMYCHVVAHNWERNHRDESDT